MNSETPNNLTQAAPPIVVRRRTGWRKKLLAIGLGLLPFVLLEAGLRMAGVGAHSNDLHAGFGNASPLFARREGTLTTSVAKEQFFVRQQFPAQKADDEFRIFCLGGSTVQGRPYRPETSFTAWLQLELSAVDRDHRYRVINCGGVSYASYRLLPVLREVLDYHPDFIVLATGHNEFLEDRTYESMKQRSDIRLWVEHQSQKLRTVSVARQLFGKSAQLAPADGQPVSGDVVQARLDADEGYAAYERDDDWHRQVVRQYEDTLREMVSLCRQNQVPLVLVSLGANLRDCPPFKSAHRDHLSVAEEQRWQELFDRASAQEKDDVSQALQLYQQAADLDDRYALLHFRMARCLDRLASFDEARRCYQRALDEDICPLRVTSQLTTALQTVARQTKVLLVDTKTVVQRSAPDRIPGFESYIDHVHPAIATHQFMAQQIVQHLISDRTVDGAALSVSDRRELYRRHLDQLPEAYFSNGRRRIGWVEGWARRQRLAEEVQPVNAPGFFRAARRSVDLHDFDRAADQLLMAMATDPDLAGQILDYSVELGTQGRASDGLWVQQQIGLSSLSASLRDRFDLAGILLLSEAGSGTQSDQFRRVRSQRDDWVEVYRASPGAWRQLYPQFEALLGGRSDSQAD